MFVMVGLVLKCFLFFEVVGLLFFVVLLFDSEVFVEYCDLMFDVGCS